MWFLRKLNDTTNGLDNVVMFLCSFYEDIIMKIFKSMVRVDCIVLVFIFTIRMKEKKVQKSR